MELNKNEIIKALECCAQKDEQGWDSPTCVDCPLAIGNEDCKNLDRNALALIKELTDENEKLTILNRLHERDVEDWQKLVESKAEEIYPEFMRDYQFMREELEGLYDDLKECREERDVRDTLNKDLMFRNEDLQKANKDLGEYAIELQNELNTCIDIKADTVRKMQERFKKELAVFGDVITVWDAQYRIDQIAKEMLEGV